MAETKYPYIRYQTLNRCFRNKYKRYYINDLIEACSTAIYEYCGKEIGCSRRTILEDINFMESDAGWQIELERLRDGHKVYYRYKDQDFTINASALSEADCAKLNETVLLLEKFRGLPCFEWVDDILFKLQSGFKKSSDTIIEFEQAPSLKGMEHFDRLFNSILYKQTLEITYKTFNGKEVVWTIHPYLIKQHNKRWFLFGKNTSKNGVVSNLPLDRIVSITQSREAYEPDDSNFKETLSNLIGVTVNKDTEIEEIGLKFSESRFPYILTKPLHKSQVVADEENKIVKIRVYPNKELESQLLQFGSDVEVLYPQVLRERIKQRIAEMYAKYE